MEIDWRIETRKWDRMEGAANCIFQAANSSKTARETMAAREVRGIDSKGSQLFTARAIKSIPLYTDVSSNLVSMILGSSLPGRRP